MRKTLWMLCLMLASQSAAAANIRQPVNPAAAGGLSVHSEQGLRAFDIASGEQAWSVLQGEHLFEPTMGDGLVFLGSTRGLIALDARDGSVRWRFGGGQTVFSPILVDDTLFAGTQAGEVVAVDAATGHLKWRRQLSGWVYTPALSRGQLVTGGSAHTLSALSPSDGTLLWQAELDQELVYRPAASDRGVVASTFAGTVSAHDDGGKLMWRASDGVASIAPVIAEGRLLLAGMDGSIRVRDPHSGALLAETRLGSRIVRPPLASADRVLILSDGRDGGIYSLSQLRWLKRFSLPAQALAPLVAADGFLMMDPKRSGKDVFKLPGSATHPDASPAWKEDKP